MPAPSLEHDRWMRLAIDEAIHSPRHPFGAVIVDWDSGIIIARGRNETARGPLWHGEITAIKQAGERPQPKDWSRYALYTTAEPCPMCQAAIVWAGLGAVVYGTSIPTLRALGWWQMGIRAAELIARSPGSACGLIGGVLETECDGLFRQACRMESKD